MSHYIVPVEPPQAAFQAWAAARAPGDLSCRNRFPQPPTHKSPLRLAVGIEQQL